MEGRNDGLCDVRNQMEATMYGFAAQYRDLEHVRVCHVKSMREKERKDFQVGESKN